MLIAKRSGRPNVWMAWCGQDDPNWDKMWAHLRRALEREGQTTNLRDEHECESWQYMGTWSSFGMATHKPDGSWLGPYENQTYCWTHQFRHRSYKGRRRYVNVMADADTQPSIEEEVPA